jgi:hypothetical protein
MTSDNSRVERRRYSMTELREQVEISAGELKSIWTLVQSASGTELPPKCYEHWTKKSDLHRALTNTAGLFPVRDKAWEVVRAVADPANVMDANRNLINFGALEMDFSIARHLSLTSYAAVAWSIYDRLANICGRLAAIADLSENPKQNPKACEDFLGKKDTLGFGAHLHLQHAYKWPLKVTYKVRNWLVHEGYEEGSTPMFNGDRIVDGFRLHDDAVVHLEKCCGYSEVNGKIEACCLGASEECWSSKDLLTILGKYHAEIDAMFSALVSWTVGSFVKQVAIFAERDRTTLTIGGI